MRLSATGNLLVETIAPKVRILRFERDDLREALFADLDIVHSPLYLEILDVALSDLPHDWTLIVDLKRLPSIGSTFYRCLLGIREFLFNRGARLILCNPRRQPRDVFKLFGAERIFTIRRTEQDALTAAEQGLGKIQRLTASTAN